MLRPKRIRIQQYLSIKIHMEKMDVKSVRHRQYIGVFFLLYTYLYQIVQNADNSPYIVISEISDKRKNATQDEKQI